MKKVIILLFVISAMSCRIATSEKKNADGEVIRENSVAAIFDTFTKEENVDKIDIGGTVFGLANAFGGDTKGVKAVEVYSFDRCSDDIKEQFNAAIKSLNDDSYETFVDVKNNSKDTKILVRKEENIYKEFVIISNDIIPGIVRIKGNVKQEDVEEVIKEFS